MLQNTCPQFAFNITGPILTLELREWVQNASETIINVLVEGIFEFEQILVSVCDMSQRTQVSKSAKFG